jgi:aspartyl-tRNA(Asn)/glutamyl-tRNA(Gln) amidotransferase subunit C
MEKAFGKICALGENLMAITRNDVEHAARLARLALSEAEKTNFTEQLGKILGYMEKLNALDTKNVLPTAHPFSSKTVWREDKTYRWAEAEDILKNAPEREEFFFKVKKVIE